VQQQVDFRNPRRFYRAGNPWLRRKRSRNPFRQGSFDLGAEMAGGRHASIFALFSPMRGRIGDPELWEMLQTIEKN
jgi:hypothetical protein